MNKRINETFCAFCGHHRQQCTIHSTESFSFLCFFAVTGGEAILPARQIRHTCNGPFWPHCLAIHSFTAGMHVAKSPCGLSMFGERKIDHEDSRFIFAGGRHVVWCGDSRFAVGHSERERQARQELLEASSSSSPQASPS